MPLMWSVANPCSTIAKTSMDNKSLIAQNEKYARETVDQFVRRFDESYRLLAYYAALPLILTPELLNYLRNRFLKGKVPWVAEVDLLLSDLCKQVGAEQYVMDTAVRACLVQEMEERLGLPRIQEVAVLLIRYLHHLSRNDRFIGQHELQTQHWAAMVYLDEQRETAVREIAESFQKNPHPVIAETRENIPANEQAELVRLSQITETLAPQLKDHPQLIEYAKQISQMLVSSNEILDNATAKKKEAVINEPDQQLTLKELGSVDISFQPNQGRNKMYEGQIFFSELIKS